MPWKYTTPRNVVTPIPTSVSTTEARIRTIAIYVEEDNALTIEIEYDGGMISAGKFKPIERARHKFVGVEATTFFRNIESNILTALRNAGKLPPGTFE